MMPFIGKGLCGTNGSLCHKGTPCRSKKWYICSWFAVGNRAIVPISAEVCGDSAVKVLLLSAKTF